MNDVTLRVTSPIDTCALSGVALNLWHPTGERTTPYELEVRTEIREQPDYPAICGSPTGNIVAELTLSQPISPSDAQAFETTVIGERPPVQSVSQVTDAGAFELRIGAHRQTYSVDEQIQPWASLAYVGKRDGIDVGVDRAFGLVGPWFVEQLDGDLIVGNGGSLLLGGCATLKNNETNAFDYVKPSMPVDGPPSDPRLEALYADPQLRLPAGTWRIYTTSSFNSSGCADQGVPYEPVRMTASVVVQVE